MPLCDHSVIAPTANLFQKRAPDGDATTTGLFNQLVVKNGIAPGTCYHTRCHPPGRICHCPYANARHHGVFMCGGCGGRAGAADRPSFIAYWLRICPVKDVIPQNCSFLILIWSESGNCEMRSSERVNCAVQINAMWSTATFLFI